MTTRFEGDASGAVQAIHTVQVEWARDQDGRFVPQQLAGTEQVWPAHLVLLAMGFLGPEDTMLEQMGVARDKRSNVQTDPGSYVTNVEGVFSAGDMRRGQSLVVWAIREGREAAQECHRYLMERQ
jgi:glutamate synthase (NADPH/NADH) small chain